MSGASMKFNAELRNQNSLVNSVGAVSDQMVQMAVNRSRRAPGKRAERLAILSTAPRETCHPRHFGFTAMKIMRPVAGWSRHSDRSGGISPVTRSALERERSLDYARDDVSPLRHFHALVAAASPCLLRTGSMPRR
jgi:hypothetical protein